MPPGDTQNNPPQFQPQVPPQPQPPISAQTPPTVEDPGKTLSIIGLVLAFVPFVQLIGLILSIVGRVKSVKVGHNGALGLIGIALNVLLGLIVTVALVLVVIIPTVREYNQVKSQAESARDSASRSDDESSSKSNTHDTLQGNSQDSSTGTSSNDRLRKQLEVDSSGYTEINYLGSTADHILQKDVIDLVLTYDGRSDVIVSAVRVGADTGVNTWSEEWDMTDRNSSTKTYLISFSPSSIGGITFTVSRK